MKLHMIRSGFVLLASIAGLNAHPMIQRVENNTPILYRVVAHNDMSDCSEFNNGKIVEIKPFSTYEQPFLLGFEKPGLLLRPVAYYDKKVDIYYPLVNDAGEFDKDIIEIAFKAWQKSSGMKYSKGADRWFEEWLCGDISLIHNHVEVFGYLLNIALTRVENDKNYHVCMIDYSEGVFSRLFIDITIGQKRKKGIIPHVKSYIGQGGFCQDGKVILVS